MQDSTKRRGRPPTYDREASIASLMRLFWKQGFSATSLDEISAATGMGRPSLYQAFGSKSDMYQLALARFVGAISERAGGALTHHPDVGDALLQFYLQVLDLYFEEASSLGCMVFCTTVSETDNHPDLRHAVKAVSDQIHTALVARLEGAVQAGQINSETDINALSVLAEGLLQHLAIRARAGDSKAALEKLAEQSVKTLLKAAQ